MASFGDTFDSPVSLTVKPPDGQEETITLPRASIRDLQPWCEEVTAEYRRVAKANLPQTLPPGERHDRLVKIEQTQATPDDIKPFLFTVAGIERMLKIALRRRGDDDAAAAREAARILDLLSFDEAKELVMRASGLFSSRQLRDIFAPKPNGDGTHGGDGPLPLPAAEPAPSPASRPQLTFG